MRLHLYRYVVDLYDPVDHVAYEADGEYFHLSKIDRDAARDSWLLDNYGLVVNRFWGRSIMDGSFRESRGYGFF